MSYIITAVFVVLASILIASVIFPDRPRRLKDRLSPNRKYLVREHKRKYFDV